MRNEKTKTQKQKFSIDHTNEVLLLSAAAPHSPDAVTFSTERELAKQTADWLGSRLVKVWNQLPTVTRVKKFTNRQTAIRRIWTAMQESYPSPASASESTRSKSERDDTKTALIISLLEHPSGATLRALMDHTGWQSHSIRGFLSAQLHKKRGLRIKSFTRNGERVYRIVASSRDRG